MQRAGKIVGRLKATINRIMAPPVFSDAEKNWTAYRLSYMLWAAMLVITLMGVGIVLIQPDNLRRWIINVAVTNGSCIILLALTRKGYVRFAAIFFGVEMWAVVTARVLTAGGMQGPVAMTYVVVILVAGLLLGERWGIAAGVVCGVTGLVLVWLQRAGLLPASVVHYSPLSFYIVYASFIAIISALQRISTRAIKNSLQDAEEELAKRKRAEESLLIKESAISSAINGMIIADFSGKLTYANPSFLKLWGYDSEDQVSGRPVISFCEPKDRMAEVMDMLKKNDRWVGELIGKRRDGSAFNVQVTASTVRDAGGQPVCMMGSFLDITESIETKRQLLESEMRYRAVVEHSNDGIAIVRGGIHIYVNPRFLEIFGYEKPEDIIGKPPLMIIHPEDRQRLLAYNRTREHGKRAPESLEFKGIRKDGTTIFLDNSIAMTFDKGEPVIIVFLKDITQRKQAEQKILESEELYTTAIEHSNDGVAHVKDGVHILVNRKFLEIYGYERPEEVVGKPTTIVVHPDYHEQARDFREKRQRGEYAPSRFEFKGIKKDGTTIVIEASITRTVYRGEPIFLVISRDITQQRRAEEALKKSEATLRSVFAASPVGISLVTLDRKVIWVNDRMSSIVGYTADEVRGTQGQNVYQTDAEAGRVGDVVYGEVLKGGIGATDTKWVHKDGRVLDIHVSAAAVDPRDFSAGVVFIVFDITDRKAAEEALKTSLTEKEVLLREIHHRVKNNLQVISSLLVLQSHYIEDTQALNMFKESVNRIRTMSRIHEKLYQSKDHGRVGFGAYIMELATQLYNSYGLNAESVTLRSQVTDISFDINTAIPLGLIVNELISNALKHAFPDGKKGEITVSLNREGDKCVLAVSDDGVGFPPHIDFRKTDSLGMQLVIELTEQLGGVIELNRDHGTAFAIRFEPGT
ncbi:MAG TPA: PAS domain S-box protein [Syntrophorhabdaceae bacterium]|nr:PAS domain S-box protein [Syntrophorhabdaceae bacterium]